MPTENGSLVDPRTASDGIHEMLVTERSILMATRVARPPPARKGADTYAVVRQAPPAIHHPAPSPGGAPMWPHGSDGDPTSTARVAHWRDGDCDRRGRRPNVTVTSE